MATLASVTLEDYRSIQDPLQIKFPRSRPVVLRRWCTEVYHDPDGTVASGVHGMPEQVQEQLEALVVMGANHLLLNPICRHAEPLESLAAVVGLA
jgi:hypothetical protein